MNSKFGFFPSTIEDLLPRGAKRVEHAILKILLASETESQNIILCNQVPKSRPLSFYSKPLENWLDNNPLHCPPKSRFLKYLPQIKRFARGITPPVILPVLKSSFNFARTFVGKLKNLIKLNRSAKLPDQSQETDTILALQELDALISFDPFNKLWSFPVENFKTVSFGWFYDAIPKRINEGENWQPDFFDNEISKFALRANHIFCDSKSAQEDLHYFFPASLGKSSVLHLGHDIERFQKRVSFEESTQMLLSFSIDPNIPYFIFVGSVEPRKNIAGLLLAAQKLKLINPLLPFQLILVGQIAGQKEIQSLIKQTNTLLPVHALNYLPDDLIPALMNRSESFVFPSKWEGFGIPILEAMTAETLVITSNLSSMPEVAEEHALYCDPYDHTSIAMQMARCLEMPAEERLQRLRAAKLHASKFTWKQTTDKMLEKINQILREKNQV